MLVCIPTFAGPGEFKDQFQKAYSLIAKDNYSDAAAILKDLLKSNPNNANVQSMIGYCYLQTGKTYDQAIDYLSKLKFPEDFTADYSDGDAKETRAPLAALRHLGEAYHMNYEFDKALKTYRSYDSLVSMRKSDERYFISKRLQEVRNAIEFQKNLSETEIFELKPINSPFPDYRPIPSASGSSIYFTTRRKNGKEQKLTESGMYHEDIYKVDYYRGVWGQPEPVAALNTDYHEAILYLSAEENKILVYRFAEGDNNGGDVYEAELKNGKWSELTKLGDDINSNDWETHSTISSKDIVFTSDRKGTQGFRDIWIYHADSKKIENMGKTINTEEDEDGAFLTEDGKTLYFSSNGHNSMGGFDIFVSHKDESGKWSEPENLGMPINSPGDDIFYQPVIHGRDAYFSSFRASGTGYQDIYFVPNTDRINIYAGKAFSEQNKPIEKLAIVIYDVESKEEKQTIYTDEQGEFIFELKAGESYRFLPYIQRDKIMEEEPEMTVEELKTSYLHRDAVKDPKISTLMASQNVNWLRQTDVEAVLTQDVVQAHLDAIAEPIVAVDTIPEIDTVAQAAQDQFEINNILFVFDRITIIKSSRKDLKKLASIMNDNEELKVKITGYTDSWGDPRYNLRLSRERAKKVKRELVKRGIAEDRITLEWFGEKDPVKPNAKPNGNDNPEGRQQNRRTEFNLSR